MNSHNSVLHILGEKISAGESREINFNVAKLHTQTSVEVPVIINRSKKPGPVVLFTAGIHGDEVNGVEIVRQLIAKGINKPKKGTIICIPVLNIFGFLNKSRELPDGRDLNRVFPGSKTGSLASQVAYKLVVQDVLMHLKFELSSKPQNSKNGPKPMEHPLLFTQKKFLNPFEVLVIKSTFQ